MLKKTIFCISLFLAAGCLAQEIQIRLECRDCVQGEEKLGGYNSFRFTITNSSDKPVKLTTENSTDWLYNSTHWTLHAEGPLDKKCIGERAVAYGDPGPGGHPFITIPANGKWVSNYGALGWGNPGAYTVWIEYDGNRAYEGDYRLKVRSNTCTFNIRYPEGADAEIFNLWRSQNPDSPACLFPMNMEPNILYPEVLVEKFPTSTYAGWALLNWGRDAASVMFKNEATGKAIIAAARREQDFIKKYWFTAKEAPNEERDMKRKSEMQQVTEKTAVFVNTHPDFLFSGFLEAKGGFNALGTGDLQTACKMLKHSLTLAWQLPLAPEKDIQAYKEGTENALDILKKEGVCK